MADELDDIIGQLEASRADTTGVDTTVTQVQKNRLEAKKPKKAGFFESLGKVPEAFAEYAAGQGPEPRARILGRMAEDIVGARGGDTEAAKRVRARDTAASVVTTLLTPWSPGARAAQSLEIPIEVGAKAALRLAGKRAAAGALGGAVGGAGEAGVQGEPVGPAAISGGVVGGVLGPVAGALTDLIPAGRGVARKVAEPPPGPAGAVDRVISALKKAPRLQKLQAAARRPEVARRVGFAKAAGAGKEGIEGLRAELRQLPGELPKAQFEPLQIEGDDVNSLFHQIKEAPHLRYFETLRARIALQKMFGGALPQRNEVELLNSVFGEKFTQALLDKRPTLEKMTDLGLQVANLPRALMSSWDLSAPFRQGAVMIGRPKEFFGSFFKMFHYLGSEKAFQGLQQGLIERPLYKLGKSAGLALTDLGSFASQREELFASKLAEKIPGIRASNRAYVGFLNKLRADVFDDLIKKGIAQGHRAEDIAPDIARFVNDATGRGALPGKAAEGASSLLATVFFSPRLMASRLNILTSPVGYARMHPFARKEAFKTLFGAAAAASTVLGLAKLGGAEVVTDTNDADFGKFKIGKLHVDPLAGFAQYIRAGSRVISEDNRAKTVGDFSRRKLAPLSALVWDILDGKTIQGDEVTLPLEAKRLLFPLVFQDAMDAYNEYGPAGLPAAIPSIFGVGLQTY